MSHRRDLRLEQGQSARCLVSQVEGTEGTAETMGMELTTAPIPHPSRAAGGEEGEKILGDMEPRKGRGKMEGDFKKWFYFSLFHPDLAINEILFCPKSSPFWLWVIWSDASLS